MAWVLLLPLPPGRVSLKIKDLLDPIFDSEGVRVAVFDLKELRSFKYLKDIYLQDVYLIRHRNSGIVAGKIFETPNLVG
jgi:hypothetical protein